MKKVTNSTDPDDLAPSLRRFRPPELTERLAFRVDNIEESNPYEAGGLVVTCDSRHIEIHFDGDSKLRWDGTWTELRWLLGRIKLEQQEIEREAETLRLLEEQRVTQEELAAQAEAKLKRQEWNDRLNAKRRGPYLKKRPDPTKPAA